MGSAMVESLCQACSLVNISKSYFTYNSDSDIPEDALSTSIGTLKTILERPNCPLCRLTLAAIGIKEGQISEELASEIECTVEWETDAVVRNGSYEMNAEGEVDDIPITRCLRVKAEPWMEPMYESDRILLVSEHESQPFFGRLWKQDQIDFDFVKYCLSGCHGVHVGCDASVLPSVNSTTESFDFMLIDVNQWCIVDGSISSEYFALSYVWGTTNTFLTLKSNVDELKTPGSLKSHLNEIPATIADAILLVEKLGYKYIWIDSLCIVQDDYTTKEAIINAMNVVYSRALCTIIAATGDGAHMGLPGVRPNTRTSKQVVEEVRGVKFIAPTHLDDYLSRTVYETRAWTFQERQLSNRALYLVDGQAIYQCQMGVYREDVVPDLSIPAVGLDLCDNFRINHWAAKESAFLEYMGLVHYYSARRITHDSDILKAYRGVSKVLSSMLKTQMHWGLPLSLFDWALLWEAKGYVERRYVCPSWTWAGWKGTEFVRSTATWDRKGHCAMPEQNLESGDYGIEDLESWLSMHTWIDWYHYKETQDEAVRICDTPKTCGERFEGLDSSRKKPSTGVPRNFEILVDNHSKPSQSLDNLPSPSLMVDRLALLHFWTVHVKFKIGNLPRGYEPNEKPISAGLTCHGLYDSRMVFAGDLWTNDNWNIPDDKICELLLLSEALPSYSEDYSEGKYQEYVNRAGESDGEVNTIQEADQPGSDDEESEARVSEEMSESDADMDGEEDDFDQQKEPIHMWHLFNAILIQPIQTNCDLFVVERVGSGKVFKMALEHAIAPGMQWKEIVLA